VMLLNSAVILTQVILDEYRVRTAMDAGVGAAEFPVFAWCYFGFSVLYIFELTLGLATQPFELYFVIGSRLARLGVSFFVSIISVLWILPFVPIAYEWMRYANIIRVLQLIDLLVEISPDFNFVLTSLNAILRGSADVLGQLFLWTSLFIVIGVQAFGGAVYAANPGLEGTAYADSFYEVLNFNDFAMGFLPLIVTLVSAGPNQDLIAGIGAAANAPGAAKLLFLLYYYTTQLLVLNIFVSFIISSYSIRLKGYMLRQEATASEAGGGGGDGDIVDGLDEAQRGSLKSLFASLQNKPGWCFHVRGLEGQDVLLRRMFQAEIDAATAEAAAHQTAASTSMRGTSRPLGDAAGSPQRLLPQLPADRLASGMVSNTHRSSSSTF